MNATLACEHLRGALAAGREKERELATTSLYFEYLHRKRRCEMLIGGDDISNDVITLGTCFSMFVYIRARFRFSLIGGNLTAQSTGSHRGIGGGIQIPETQLQALLPFATTPPECPGELTRRSTQHCRMLHVASVFTPCCLLLRVVGSCCAKFGTDQTFGNNVGSFCVHLQQHVALTSM